MDIDERWLTQKMRQEMSEEADVAEVDWLVDHADAADELIARYKSMLGRFSDADSQCIVCGGHESGMHKHDCEVNDLLTFSGLSRQV
jgi:hypothetical protein